MGTPAPSQEPSIELPEEFARKAANVTGLDEPPETLEAWWNAIARQFEESPHAVAVDDMYSNAPTRHEVHVDGRVRYAYCVVDALAAAVMEEASP